MVAQKSKMHTPLHGIVEWLGYAIEFISNVHIAKTISYFCAALFLICAVVKTKSCYILLIRCQTTLCTSHCAIAPSSQLRKCVCVATELNL